MCVPTVLPVEYHAAFSLMLWIVGQLLNSYINCSPSWTVERGSSLCPWDINYYFLKFKDPQTDTVQMHWSLPPDMQALYDELNRLAQTPEAQAGEYSSGLLKLTICRLAFCGSIFILTLIYSYCTKSTNQIGVSFTIRVWVSRISLT